MNNRRKLIACLRELGVKIDIRLFEDRVLAQKIACLLQLKGIDLGYDFGLYVRGPYSPALTQDLYRHTEEFTSFKPAAKVSKSEKATLASLKDLFGLSPTLLEIGATYGFFNIVAGLDPIGSQRMLKRVKPFFSDAQISIGVSKAKQFLFEPTVPDMQALRDELDLWQSAAMLSMGRISE